VWVAFSIPSGSLSLENYTVDPPRYHMYILVSTAEIIKRILTYILKDLLFTTKINKTYNNCSLSLVINTCTRTSFPRFSSLLKIIKIRLFWSHLLLYTMTKFFTIYRFRVHQLFHVAPYEKITRI
jgi:hypothetical protein